VSNNNNNTAVRTAAAHDAAEAARAAEARRESAVVSFDVDSVPYPRYRHVVLSNGEVVSERIAG